MPPLPLVGVGWGEGEYCVIINHMKHTNIARILRKQQTPQEAKLWNLLRNRQFFGLKFKRQHPIGDYVVDFVCIEQKIIVELDGGQHNIPVNIIKDSERTIFLESEGYRVFRIWNNDVDNNLEGVFLELKRQIIDGD